MATIVIKCPTTGKLIDTKWQVSPEHFETSDYVNNKVTCPHCGGNHVWSKKDVILMDLG